MTRIHILSTTDRPDSMALKVSEFVKPKLEAEGVEVDIISLQDFPIKDVAGGPYGSDIPSVKAFNERVLNCDGLLMVVPEYNGSFPGILKLFIDYLPFPESFDKLPIAFIGEAAGAFGALRAVEQLQMVCNYRNAYLYPERVFLQRVYKIFDPETGISDELQAKLLDSMITGFAAFTSRNKIERQENAGAAD
ncbi:NAD(P)H-dependent FMN reductase [Cyclonatronum proteinivorum]|uniref:NAD(P)H-dependent FMN reductase n=1 Tax=Cyclonatronum proteinivorum TaxID=1457365 RepID=A0A345UMY8_9BACT|nr:NAD(P)H-dependent oxidoreductase [Cyclonatronum proteinivorum]AXJ01840.1 NAD(P)H-dependent FMN reductase [Cyclonatronum proteinivorum]